MIKAGNKEINDSGFAVVTETVGGVARQALVLELSGGIDEATLAALCTGPVQVVDAEGNVIQTHNGPFRVATHGLKLVRTQRLRRRGRPDRTGGRAGGGAGNPGERQGKRPDAACKRDCAARHVAVYHPGGRHAGGLPARPGRHHRRRRGGSAAVTTISCKDSAEVSCIIGNILAELEQPCQSCQPDGAVVLTGPLPRWRGGDGAYASGHVLEVEGGEDLLPEIRGRRCPMDDKAKKSADFILGSKAADLWLYTCDACANEKVIPKKYRYTTGTGLMNAAEEICDLIESANLLDLREYPRERLGNAAPGPRQVRAVRAEGAAAFGEQAVPRRERPQGGHLEQGHPDGPVYVREMVQQGPAEGGTRASGCPAAIAALH